MFVYKPSNNMKVYDRRSKLTINGKRVPIYGFSEEKLIPPAKKAGYITSIEREDGNGYTTLRLQYGTEQYTLPVYRTHKNLIFMWLYVGNKTYIGVESVRLKDMFRYFRKHRKDKKKSK